MDKIQAHTDIIKAKRYNSHPAGIECKEIVMFLNGNMFSKIKYMWRYLLKDSPVLDLQKAVEYGNWEVERLNFNTHTILEGKDSVKYVLDTFDIDTVVMGFEPNIQLAFRHTWNYLDAVARSNKFVKYTQLAIKELHNSQSNINKEINRLKGGAI